MNRAAITLLSAGLLVSVGCSARSGPPLTYLALKRPEGPITAQDASIEEKHGRGGWYFGNNGFRPAADLQLYLEEAHQSADSNLLGDADIVLAVPFAFDILFFGYNHATDVVTANEAEEE
jgi:hypothetical protein